MWAKRLLWRPGALFLAPKISWSHTLRLFLVRVRNRSSLCTTSTNNFGWSKKPYHNCGELSDARHPSRVRDEFSYRLDVIRAAGGGHIELYCEYNQIYFTSYLSLVLYSIYRLTKLSASFLIILYKQYETSPQFVSAGFHFVLSSDNTVLCLTQQLH
jgi:hypothetical protein